MLKRHKLLGLDDVVAGMALSEDVRDGHGNVLLPKAATLTDAMLASLRRRGIEMVNVVDDAVSEEQLRAERERVQQRLAKLFRKSKGDRISTMLRQRILEYRLGEMQ